MGSRRHAECSGAVCVRLPGQKPEHRTNTNQYYSNSQSCTLVLRKLPQSVTIPIASSSGSPSPYSFLCYPFFLLAEVKDEDDDVAAVVVLSSMCRELLWTRMRKHPWGCAGRSTRVRGVRQRAEWRVLRVYIKHGCLSTCGAIAAWRPNNDAKGIYIRSGRR